VALARYVYSGATGKLCFDPDAERPDVRRGRLPLSFTGAAFGDIDLTGFSWTKLIEIISVEGNPEDGEEAIARSRSSPATMHFLLIVPSTFLDFLCGRFVP
jgi:hypothetical protein